MPLPQFLVTSFLIATATALPLVPDVVQKIDKAANDFPRSPAIDRAAVGLAAAAGWHLSPFASRDRVGNMQSGSPSAGPADQQSLNNRNGNLGGSVKLPTDNGQGNGYANGNNGVSSNGNGNVIVDQMRNANLEGDLSRWSIQWSDKKREWMQRCLESMVSFHNLDLNPHQTPSEFNGENPPSPLPNFPTKNSQTNSFPLALHPENQNRHALRRLASARNRLPLLQGVLQRCLHPRQRAAFDAGGRGRVRQPPHQQRRCSSRQPPGGIGGAKGGIDGTRRGGARDE